MRNRQSCRERSIASLREGGGPRSGGRSLRSFQYHLTSLSRTLPQSPSAPAPSRREPFSAISSAYINKSSHKPFDWSVGTFCCCVFSVKNNRERGEGVLKKHPPRTPPQNLEKRDREVRTRCHKGKQAFLLARTQRKAIKRKKPMQRRDVLIGEIKIRVWA